MPVAARVVAHLFVADLDRPEIADDDRHHVERVLRLRPGEAVTVSDGSGGIRRCAFAAGGGLEPVSETERVPAPAPAIAVGFALLKGDRTEHVVQKLTECGVDRIVPFAAERSVVRWDGDRAGGKDERLRRVAREAAMQSRQVRLPVVEPVRPFADAAAAAGATAALAEQGGDPPALSRPFVLVGPEGGWSDAERAADLPLVSLGPSVLRAETAAVAAGVLLTALRSGVVAETPSTPRSAFSHR